MIQQGGWAGFPLEPLNGLAVARVLSRQKLQRHLATELRVFRAIHDSHAAAAELLNDAIVGYTAIGGRRWHGAILVRGATQVNKSAARMPRPAADLRSCVAGIAVCRLLATRHQGIGAI